MRNRIVSYRQIRRTLIFLAVITILTIPGIAIARLGSSSTSEGASPGQGGGVVLTGGSYSLELQPAPADGRVDHNAANTLTGGSYQLINSPQIVPGSDGCCCRANLPCTMK